MRIAVQPPSYGGVFILNGICQGTSGFHAAFRQPRSSLHGVADTRVQISFCAVYVVAKHVARSGIIVARRARARTRETRARTRATRTRTRETQTQAYTQTRTGTGTETLRAASQRNSPALSGNAKFCTSCSLQAVQFWSTAKRPVMLRWQCERCVKQHLEVLIARLHGLSPKWSGNISWT